MKSDDLGEESAEMPLSVPIYGPDRYIIPKNGNTSKALAPVLGYHNLYDLGDCQSKMAAEDTFYADADASGDPAPLQPRSWRTIETAPESATADPDSGTRGLRSAPS